MSPFSFERRWLLSIFHAILPNEPQSQTAGNDGLEPYMGRFVESFFSAAPNQVRWGLRLAAWFITFYPLCWRMKCRTFHGLSAEDQQTCLMSLGRSRFYLIREIPMLLKIVATMGIFALPEEQIRFGAVLPDTEPPAWFKTMEEGR